MRNSSLRTVVVARIVSIRGLEGPVVDQKTARAEQLMSEFIAPLRDAGLEIETHVMTGTPVPQVLKLAQDESIQGVIIGSHGKKPMEEALVGSLSEEVTRESKKPVLFIRFGILSGKTPKARESLGADLCRKAFHPTDFSDCSNRALDLIRKRAALGRSEIVLAHVLDDSLEGQDQMARLRGRAEENLAKMAEELRTAGHKTTTHLIVGDPVADTIRVAGEEDCTSIVLGSTGKGLVQETVLGSVSQDILRMSNKPVVVVH